MFEWEFPTHVVFGAGRFESAYKYLRGFGKRAFVVTSRSFLPGGSRAAVLDALLAQLKKIGVETQVFGEIEPNPRTTTIDRAASLAREFRPRYVLALGGGSVMDSAKCVALLAVNDGTIFSYAYQGPSRPMQPFNHALPVVCIPTVAASGSETSLYAVVTDWSARRKTEIFNDAIRPALSIIDPVLTYTVGAAQTVDGAFDIITHVMESYLSTPVPAPLQDRLTEAFVETVVTHLPRVLENPHDEFGRSQLSQCSALALSGVFLGRDGGWPVHSLEHGLSAHADVPHGRGLALLLPRIMAFDETVIPEKIASFNRKIFNAPTLDSGLVAFMKRVGAWHTLGELVPPGTDLRELIEKTVDHAMEVRAVWKKGEEPYLDNIRPLSRTDAIGVLDCTM